MKINQHQCDSCGKREDSIKNEKGSYSPLDWADVIWNDGFQSTYTHLCAQCWDEIKGRFKKV